MEKSASTSNTRLSVTLLVLGLIIFGLTKLQHKLLQFFAARMHPEASIPESTADYLALITAEGTQAFNKAFTWASAATLILFTLLIVTATTLYRRLRGEGKKLGAGHGTAQISDAEELHGYLGEDGLVLSQKVRLAQKASFEHAVIVGPTGSGKSSTFFIPNLLKIPPNASIVVSDPKGELYELTSEHQRSIGRKVVVFAPLEPEVSVGYNPVARYKNATQVKELAQISITNGNMTVELLTGSKAGGAEWLNMATPLWAAALNFVQDLAPPYNTMAAALTMLTGLGQKEIKHIMTTYAKPAARREYNIFTQASGSERTASSILTVLASSLQIFTDENIAKVTTLDEFDPASLRHEPTAVYVIAPERKSAFLSPLMSVFYTQVLDTLLGVDGLPVYFLLDEFANIGLIPQFAQVAATARSRGISLSIGIQGLEQLERNYGTDNAADIMNNLKIKMFYPGLAHHTAQYASNLGGVTSVSTVSYSYSPDQGSKSQSISDMRREVLHPDEIRRLDADKVLIIAHNRNPVIDKQLAYYKDRNLMKLVSRAKLVRRRDANRMRGWYEPGEIREQIRLMYEQEEEQHAKYL